MRARSISFFILRRGRRKLLHHGFAEIRSEIREALKKLLPTMRIYTDLFEEPSANRLGAPNDDGVRRTFRVTGAEIPPARHRAIGRAVMALWIKI